MKTITFALPALVFALALPGSVRAQFVERTGVAVNRTSAVAQQPPAADARRFTAIVAKLGGAADANYDHVSIAVDRYSTVGAHGKAGAGATVEPIAGVSMASGFIHVDGLAARRLVVAQTVGRGAGTQVLLVFAPSLPDATYGDIFGVIVLDLDSRGRGTGELIAGATLALNEQGILQVQQRLGPVQLLADVKVLD